MIDICSLAFRAAVSVIDDVFVKCCKLQRIQSESLIVSYLRQVQVKNTKEYILHILHNI